MISVGIKDDDADDDGNLPILSIFEERTDDNQEGISEAFYLYSDRVLTSDLSITLEITETRGTNSSRPITITKRMRANTSILRFSQTIPDDNVDTNGGSMMVRIKTISTSQYRVVESPNDRVSTSFYDLSSGSLPTPVISIQPLDNETREGESARFSIERDGFSSVHGAIRLQISEVRGSNLPVITSRTVTTYGGNYRFRTTLHITPQIG